MRKWEYQTIRDSYGMTDEEINDWGEEGWELISCEFIYSHSQHQLAVSVAVMKREKA